MLGRRFAVMLYRTSAVEYLLGGYSMKNLAQLSFEYLCLMQFGTEDQIDPDYAVKLLEQLGLILQGFTPEEQEALASVARGVKERINAPPDEYGYQPGLLASAEERAFIDALISKQAFEEGYEV